jgi:hypothetical protein
MAYPFRGTISGTVDSVAMNLPTLIESFRINNNTLGAVTFNVYMISNSGSTILSPLNKSLNAGEKYEETETIVMLATEKIRISSTGSVAYDFTINNTEAPEV